MASTTGGQFLFAKSGQVVNLGLTDNGTAAPLPASVAGAFNIEVFTSVSGGSLPALASGFAAGVIATGTAGATPSLSNGFLTATQLQLFTGDYDVSDVSGQPGSSPALITLGSGNQTVHGAAGDTLVGGSGNQQLDGLRNAGAETIIGGTGNFAIFGGKGDSISGSASAANSVTSGQIVATAGGMSINIAPGGNYVLSSGAGNTVKASAGSATILLQGAAGDVVDMTGNTGNEVLIGSTIGGGDKITGGSGNAVLVGATGDTLIAGSGGVTNIFGNGLDGKSGQVAITVGTGGFDIISNGAGDTVTALAGSANVLMAVAANNVVDLTGNTGTEVVFSPGSGAGNSKITGGSGTTILVGAANDTLIGGAGGTSNIFGTAGSVRVVVGVGGTEVIASAAGDTITGALNGTANALIGGAKGDLINLTGHLGSNTVIGVAGGEAITAGNGTNTVYGGAGDTITTGAAGTTYVDALPGKMTVNIGNSTGTGSAPGANVIGSTVSGAGDTIVGSGSGTLNYNSGGAGDFVNLAGSTGNATINTFSFGPPGADTVIAGNGADTVFAGGGDRIGVGNGPTVGGTHTWDHSTTATGASVLFGTNDTVSGVTYGTVPGAVTLTGAAGSSTAKVTVSNFSGSADKIFYSGQNSTTDSSIITTAQSSVTIQGKASTVITLPDGTQMTLFGFNGSLLGRFTS